jgi:hypothetical protein
MKKHPTERVLPLPRLFGYLNNFELQYLSERVLPLPRLFGHHFILFSLKYFRSNISDLTPQVSSSSNPDLPITNQLPTGPTTRLHAPGTFAGILLFPAIKVYHRLESLFPTKSPLAADTHSLPRSSTRWWGWSYSSFSFSFPGEA